MYNYIRTLSADMSTTLLLHTLSSFYIIKVALSFPVEVVLQYVHCLGKRVTKISLTKGMPSFLCLILSRVSYKVAWTDFFSFSLSDGETTHTKILIVESKLPQKPFYCVLTHHSTNKKKQHPLPTGTIFNCQSISFG